MRITAGAGLLAVIVTTGVPHAGEHVRQVDIGDTVLTYVEQGRGDARSGRPRAVFTCDMARRITAPTHRSTRGLHPAHRAGHLSCFAHGSAGGPASIRRGRPRLVAAPLRTTPSPRDAAGSRAGAECACSRASDAPPLPTKDSPHRRWSAQEPNDFLARTDVAENPVKRRERRLV